MNVSAIFIHCIVIITLTPLLYAYSDDTRLGIQLSDGDTCQKTRSTRCIQCAQDYRECGVCAGDIDYYDTEGSTIDIFGSDNSNIINQQFVNIDIQFCFHVEDHVNNQTGNTTKQGSIEWTLLALDSNLYDNDSFRIYTKVETSGCILLYFAIIIFRNFYKNRYVFILYISYFLNRGFNYIRYSECCIKRLYKLFI